MKVWDRDGNPVGEDLADVLYFGQWLGFLSSPRILQAMRRMPTREHLLRMLDAFLPYARSTRRWHYRADNWRPDPQDREARALELRAVIERWNSPEISQEITRAARALLRADGLERSDQRWDTYEEKFEFPPEDYLLWPEGIPLQLREEAKKADAAALGTGTSCAIVPSDPPQISTGGADENHESG
jgi:hypothetical protein